jgi:ankyrin repeat protein
MLLKHGAGVEVGDKEGCTPMHLASRCGDSDSLQLLVEGPVGGLRREGETWRRPDVNTRDASGWTPIHEAANEGNTQCIQLLLDYGIFRKRKYCLLLLLLFFNFFVLSTNNRSGCE